jgi:hypothetical protein
MGYASNNIVNPQYTKRDTGTLAQTGTKPLFVVTGKVLLTYLLGEVTTVIQAQADATKLTKTNLAGTTTDICATNDITGDVVGSFYTITGTPANAMVNSTTNPAALIATPVVVDAGTINMNCAASNTGSVKWTILYIPLEPGATVQPV